MKRVLIANRGEIAIRVIRACKDHGIESVAIYSEEDRTSLHAQAADFAYSLSGVGAKDTYLNIKKIIALAITSESDAVHPGYGFLSENAEFAQAVIDAGLIWIGPPPSAISALGDKVSARRIAAAAGAPLVAGTKDPVSGHEEVVAFAQEYGLPVAIKAAFGGGGRGLKVAHTIDEIPELFASAVREAISGFGRGECFVERYLEKPRHVETQVLVDQFGSAVVISTRDCSLQRRHQKLVEEAPAPFLTQAQVDELYRSSKAIMKEAGYVGAGTCEFLIGQDGTISFLEVNTRLQVEHPVSEEVTGIDLVREQFRIAMGEPLGFEDPIIRGHSIEFRINGEDPGRSFLPSPGQITIWSTPSGPGVRVDAGFQGGDEIGGNFDSLLAKLIVTGATRTQAIERARRALSEFTIEGLPTALPFHRAIMEDSAFTQDFKIYTSYIENEFDNQIPAYSYTGRDKQTQAAAQSLVAEVNGKRFEITVHAPAPVVKRRRAKQSTAGAAAGTALTSPMQGTVVKVAVEEGAVVKEGDLIIVLEAMKMEQPLNAHKSGVVTNLTVVIGETVASARTLCDIIDL
jgi:acetyl-CoA/propionyl-CoA carboxylase, biotin carboxylase, biotin carboxyl carrier protein